MMDQNTPTAPQNTKQQIVEVLKNANNVLVTVSANPSVDQLSACIGLTLMLNKLEKHCTAVFSGKVPSTIEFLQPEKTLEQNTDSLRDFIISLDRSKADKLRYKIEDNVVKIFITPYRTSLSEADLQYSQGDFNVDVVVALGVDKREHLDEAITAHGRILHDATVVGVSCGEIPTVVGSINWHEPTSSSLSEMLVSISEAFQSGILDTQMATAFLTGIVAQTERFSNEKTSPKVMTISAQLMAAGANQQLIATQLNTKSVTAPIASGVEAPKEAEFAVSHTNEPAKADSSSQSSPRQPEVDENKPVEAPKEPARSTPNEPTGLSAPAPAFELNNSTDPGDELERIDIDKAGQLHDLSPAAELERKAEEARIANQKQGVPMMHNREKVIEPLPAPAEEKPTSGYIYEPPQNGGTFTASTMDDASKEVSAAGVVPETPILTHDHLEDAQKPALEDSARKAVVDAVSSVDYKPVTNGPTAALNAQPMSLDPNEGNPSEAIDPNIEVSPPPIVPPPIMMPPVMPPPVSNDPTDITMPTPGS